MKRTFNGYGQVAKEFQSHSGPVVDASTPAVQYSYSTPDPAAGRDYSRLLSTTYPNGRVLDYRYAAGLDSDVGRVTAVSETVGGVAADLESYLYLGLGTVVERARQGARDKLTYVRQKDDVAAGSDAGDMYSGLDRFGRVVDQNWVRTAASAAGTSTVRHQQGYDRAGNALYRRDLVFQALSELYQYDQLGRLTSYKRGLLTASTAGGPYDTVASPYQQQSWTLDARGNKASETTGAATVSRTFNAANETATVGGSAAAAPTYDAAGNATANDGRSYVYDAWDRLKSVAQGATTPATYAYDALRRRIKETPAAGASAAVDVYFSGSRAVEERTGGVAASNATAQYVHGATGALVLRDSLASGSVVASARLYAQQDAVGDVVALVGGAASNAGDPQERYSYLPYGAHIVMAANGTLLGGTAHSWRYLFQGGRSDAATGLYIFGFRDYDPASGVWMQRDPVGLADSVPNLTRRFEARLRDSPALADDLRRISRILEAEPPADGIDDRHGLPERSGTKSDFAARDKDCPGTSASPVDS